MAMILPTFLWITAALAAVSIVTAFLHRSVRMSTSIFLGSFGALCAYVLVNGLGMGDTWIVYPPRVTWGWLWPVTLWTAAAVLAVRRP